MMLVDLEQILVLILNHIRSTVDQLSAGLFSSFGTDLIVLVISVSGLSFLRLLLLSTWVPALRAVFNQ